MSKHGANRRTTSGVSLQTANGLTMATEVVDVIEPRLKVNISPLILEQTPAVLSVGMRCMQDGMSFIWHANTNPYMLRPDGSRIELVVEGFVPHMLAEGMAPSKGSMIACPAVQNGVQRIDELTVQDRRPKGWANRVPPVPYFPRSERIEETEQAVVPAVSGEQMQVRVARDEKEQAVVPAISHEIMQAPEAPQGKEPAIVSAIPNPRSWASVRANAPRRLLQPMQEREDQSLTLNQRPWAIREVRVPLQKPSK